MHRPIIGLTCNELDKENLPKQFINEAYINSVIRAGGCPIILPITNDYDTIQAQVNLLDGLIVTGGIDVNPMIYNENPEPLQGNSSLDRDYYEMRVLKYANEKQIPIFGICRGIQMLNVYFKGSLYQDLSYCKRSIIKHAQQEKRENPSHKIHIEKDSFLYPSLSDEAYVNSFHHQAIKDLAPHFKVVAKAPMELLKPLNMSLYPFMPYSFIQKPCPINMVRCKTSSMSLLKSVR